MGDPVFPLWKLQINDLNENGTYDASDSLTAILPDGSSTENPPDVRRAISDSGIPVIPLPDRTFLPVLPNGTPIESVTRMARLMGDMEALIKKWSYQGLDILPRLNEQIKDAREYARTNGFAFNEFQAQRVYLTAEALLLQGGIQQCLFDPPQLLGLINDSIKGARLIDPSVQVSASGNAFLLAQYEGHCDPERREIQNIKREIVNCLLESPHGGQCVDALAELPETKGLIPGGYRELIQLVSLALQAVDLHRQGDREQALSRLEAFQAGIIDLTKRMPDEGPFYLLLMKILETRFREKNPGRLTEI